MKTADDIIRDKGGTLVTVAKRAPVIDALKIMNTNKVGAILVTHDGESVGIWTERDLMRNTLDETFDPKTTPIERVMTRSLIFAPHTDTVYNLMDKFLGLRVRHLLIQKANQTIGMLSSGDVIKASMQEKDQELKQLNSMVSWEYYENWRWSPESK